MKLYWQSPKFFKKAGLFLKVGDFRVRIIPVWQ